MVFKYLSMQKDRGNTHLHYFYPRIPIRSLAVRSSVSLACIFVPLFLGGRTQRSSMQLRMGDWQFHIEETYHALALGDPEPAIKLGIVAQRATLAVWEPLLEAVTQVPTELMPANIEEQAYNALVQAGRHQYTQDGVTAIILYRWLLTTFQGAPSEVARLQLPSLYQNEKIIAVETSLQRARGGRYRHPDHNHGWRANELNILWPPALERQGKALLNSLCAGW